VKSVNGVQENNSCVVWRKNEKYKYIVWVKCRYCNVKKTAFIDHCV